MFVPKLVASAPSPQWGYRRLSHAYCVALSSMPELWDGKMAAWLL